MQTIVAPLFIGPQYHFGVGMSFKAISLGLQFFAQVQEVVNFSIEDDPAVFLIVGDRLMTAVKIDDTQAGHGDRRVFELRLTPIVGTAMLDCHAHRGHVRPHGASISARIKLYPTANTTHDWQLILTHPNRLTRSI